MIINVSVDLSLLQATGYLLAGPKSRYRSSLLPYVSAITLQAVFFNGEVTSLLFRNALLFVSDVAGFAGPLVLAEFSRIRGVQNFLRLLNMLLGTWACSLAFRWPAGLLSNYFTVMPRLTNVLLRKGLEVAFRRRVSWLLLRKFPSLIVTSTVYKRDALVREANMYTVPLVGLIDTRVNYLNAYVSYPVMGNSRTILLRINFLRLVLQAYLFGLSRLFFLDDSALVKFTRRASLAALAGSRKLLRRWMRRRRARGRLFRYFSFAGGLLAFGRMKGKRSRRVVLNRPRM